MSEADSVTRYFSALNKAWSIVKDITEGAAIHRFAGAKGQSYDFSDELLAHQQEVVEILTELVAQKERRKAPRI